VPRRPAPRWLVWVALGTVYVVWGSTYLAIAVAVRTLPPLLAAGVRFAVAAAILGGWLVLTRRARSLRASFPELRGAAIVGLCLLLGGNGLVMIAEREVPSGLAALIVGSVPLWVLLYRTVAGDRVRRIGLAGVAVGFVGVALLTLPTGISGETSWLGMLVMVGASASWAFGTFVSPRLALPRDPAGSTTLQMAFGSAGLIAAGLITGELASADASRFSPDSVIALAYLVVFGSLIAFSAYTWLLQHASVSTVATYAYVNPVVAVVLGAALLGEQVTGSMLAGATLVIAAVAFILRESGGEAA
jgi:drug/metabolite transporter (DMT)-like permease